MASRTLHLAAAKLLLDEISVADERRFRLGAILPDAGERVSAHFRVRIDGGTKTIMELSGFRSRFADKMDDPLYLGYYLHLVQDIVFRKIFYLGLGWKADAPGKVERLYDDYHILNAWAIQKFALRDDLTAPEDFSAEPLAAVSNFELPEFLAELHADFTTPPPPGKCVYFTKAIAEEFLSAAVPLCLREIAALREGKTVVNERECAWPAKQEPDLSVPREPS